MSVRHISVGHERISLRALGGPAPGLLAWSAGTFLQLFQPALWPLGHYAALCVIGTSAWLVSHCLTGHRLVCLNRHVCFRMVCVVCMAFALTGWRAANFQQQALLPALEGVDLWVTGVVAEMPQTRADGIRFMFKLEHATRHDDGNPVQLPDSLSLGWYSGGFDSETKALPALRAGERWRLPVRLKRPHGLVNPGGFDAELWMWSQGLQASGHVREANLPQRLGSTWHALVEQWRQSTREAIYRAVSDSRWAGQMAALLVGDQSSITAKDWELFRHTGIAHLMSISGLHITLWAVIARRLVSALWRHSDLLGRSWCLRYPAVLAGLWGGLCFAWAYALFSGWGVPAQRTVCMLTVVSLLQWRACRWPVWECWFLAAAAVGVWDPWALLQPGFWLSFVAVGVLFLMPQQSRATVATGFVLPSTWQRVKGHLQQLWREQWWLTLALTPLTLWLFQQVSVVGLGVNLLAIPWVTLVVTPLAFAGLLWSPLWQVGGLALQALMAMLEPLASLSWAVWRSAAPPWWLGLLGLVGAAVWIRYRQLVVRVVALACWLPMLFWQSPRPENGSVQLLFADVGQGNAVLVRTAQHSLMFDTGPRFGVDSDAGQRVLLPVLQHMDERLDTLVLSHQDSDHTGGVFSLKAQHSQAMVWSSITHEHWLSQRLDMQQCSAGQRWEWEGVAFEFVHPLASDYNKPFSPNARSCVLRIHAQGQTVLLTADIEALQEQALVQRMGDALRADVLLVPHHGSKTSSTEGFIDTVQPRWALFQHGYRNRYGHPAAVVVDRYKQRGIRMLYSPSCGAMHWRSDQPQEVLCQRDLDKRYWRF